MLVVYVKSSFFDLAPALGSCLVIEVLGSGESDNQAGRRNLLKDGVADKTYF